MVDNRYDKFPQAMLEERPPLERSQWGFSLQHEYSKAEYLMSPPGYLEAASRQQLADFGAEVCTALVNRGPYIIDIRFGVERCRATNRIVAVADTPTFPVHTRNRRELLNSWIDERTLEQCRPLLKKPSRLHFDERYEWPRLSTRPSKPSSVASRLLSALKKAGTPMEYDGPRASDKYHSW